MPSLKKKTKGKTLRIGSLRKKSRSRSRSSSHSRSHKSKKRSRSGTVKRRKLNDLKYIEYPDYNNNVLVDKDFRKKVIYGANMKNTNLSGAKLQGTKFVDCVFNNTNFDNAFIDPYTEFINCSFKNAKTDNIKYVNGAVKEKFETVFSLNSASYA
jgi:uncharacterized protein YjbI with pentapeptide repeats